MTVGAGGMELGLVGLCGEEEEEWEEGGRQQEVTMAGRERVRERSRHPSIFQLSRGNGHTGESKELVKCMSVCINGACVCRRDAGVQNDLKTLL